jgi:hypothetical protein
MKKIIVAVAVAYFVFFTGAGDKVRAEIRDKVRDLQTEQAKPAAAAPAAKQYEPTEPQKARLLLRKKDAESAQQQLAFAQARMNERVAEFNDEVKAVEKENSWPETLAVDFATLAFSEPPAPKPAEKK